MNGNTANAALAVREIMFDGDPVSVMERDGAYFVAMKPICEVLGVDWEAQRQMINRDPVLNQVTCIIQVTSVGKDGKTYPVEMVCLPLSYLNGWLFKIDANRYEGERQEKIIRYQKECYDVLFSHFFEHLSKSSPPQWPDYLQAADQELKMLNVIHKQQDAATKAAERIVNRQAGMEDYDCVPITRKMIEKKVADMQENESENSLTALQMAKEGASMNAIARRLWGGSNGRRVRQIRSMLSRHGMGTYGMKAGNA